MKLSFKLVLFINVFISAVVIIIANRFAINIFLPLQIKEQLKTELIAYIEECGEFLPDKEDFQSCIRSSEKMSLIKGFTGRYVVCSEKMNAGENAVCNPFLVRKCLGVLCKIFPTRKFNIPKLKPENHNGWPLIFMGPPKKERLFCYP